MNPNSDLGDLPRFRFLDAEFERLTRESEKPQRSGRWAIRVALAGAMTALVIVALLALIDSGDKSGLGPSKAQAALHRFADATATDQDLIAGPGQYLYQRAITDAIPAAAFGEGAVGTGDTTTFTSERWVNGDGQGSVVVSSKGKEPREAPFGMEGVFGGPDAGTFGGSLKLGYDEILALPRDPTELLGRVKDLESKNGGGVVGALASLLDVPLPADLQAALLDAAALLPGASLEEAVEAPTGETLTAVSFEQQDGSMTYELLFDPESNTYRGHALVLADGQRYYGSLILERGVVDSDGAVPAPSSGD